MAPIRRARARKQEAAAQAQTQTCLDALRLLALTRDAPAPADELALDGTGQAGDATTPPPSPSPPPLLPQPQTRPEPESQQRQEAEVETDPGTSKQHSSPPKPEEAPPAQEPSRVERNIRGVLKAILDMAAFPDERYDLYGRDFFQAYLQSPRPIDPPPMPNAERTAGLGLIKGRYPYLADEVARIEMAAEQREVLSRGLLQVEAATLAALEAEFHEATLDGKEAMQAKLEAEVQYAKARFDTEAMIDMVSGAKVG